MDDNTERNLQSALDASKKRLEELEKRYNTAIDQYHDYLGKDIEIEKSNIKILEEELKEIQQDKIKSLQMFDKYKNLRDYQDKTLYSLNNFEGFVAQTLNVLHLENMCILKYVVDNDKELNYIKKSFDKMFYENIKDKIGIKVDYEKY